jgi:hypothetical protein
MRYALLSIPLLVTASTLAPAAPWMCSINQGTDCDILDSDCQPPHELANIPTFVSVDVAGDQITLLAPDHLKGTVTPILAKDSDSERVLLAGIEAGRGWTMVIVRSDGTMTLAVVGQGGGFMLFGNCVQP